MSKPVGCDPVRHGPASSSIYTAAWLAASSISASVLPTSSPREKHDDVYSPAGRRNRQFSFLYDILNPWYSQSSSSNAPFDTQASSKLCCALSCDAYNFFDRQPDSHIAAGAIDGFCLGPLPVAILSGARLVCTSPLNGRRDLERKKSFSNSPILLAICSH